MNNMNFKKGLLLGLAAGAAAGFLAHKNRKTLAAKMWMIKARAEVWKKVAKLKDVTKSNYEEIIDDVVAKYKTGKYIAAAELEDFSENLKSKWSRVKKKFDEQAREEEDE